MNQRLMRTLVIVLGLCGLTPAGILAAQSLSRLELAGVEDWFRRTSARTGEGHWGVAIGTMDGRILWSVNAHQELIPASTVKIFTVGFTRARAGGGARIATRVIGRGRLDSLTGRWQGGWQLELGAILPWSVPGAQDPLFVHSRPS